MILNSEAVQAVVLGYSYSYSRSALPRADTFIAGVLAEWMSVQSVYSSLPVHLLTVIITVLVENQIHCTHLLVCRHLFCSTSILFMCYPLSLYYMYIHVTHSRIFSYN